ncbi:MAG: hypothetical protein MAG715_00237 [Methanonatronarchaeales archaeon]|nr:hypothetical protein [Methanonatronarchaeales archaeon]
MPVARDAERAVSRALEVLPSTREELVLSGIVSKVNERLVELKLAEEELARKYGSLGELEEKVEREGVSPDDHSLYNDLLEWRAIKEEKSRLTDLLESL